MLQVGSLGVADAPNECKAQQFPKALLIRPVARKDRFTFRRVL